MKATGSLFALTLLALLLTGPAEAACRLEPAVKLPVIIQNGKIFVPGTIEGHPVEFLVDPAEPDVLLQDAARRFGVYPNNLGVVPEASIGGLPLRDLPMRVRTSSFANLGAPDAVAILGRDFLYRFDVEFDIAHHVISLFVPQGCEGSNLAYWTDHYNVLDMQPNFTRTVNLGPQFSPYIFPHINVNITVNGREIFTALDSGYSASSLSMAAAHQLGIDRGSSGVVEADATPDLLDGYVSRTWVATFDEVKLDAESIKSVALRFRDFDRNIALNRQRRSRPPVVNDNAEMVLGADFLISHRVLISYSQHKVYFSYAEGAPFQTGVLPVDVGAMSR